MIDDFSAYRALALDIDGTLLRSDHSLSPRVADAIRTLNGRAVPVILTSARPPRSVASLARELGLSCPFVALNGAFIGSTGESVQQLSIEVDTLSDLLAMCRSQGDLTLNLYGHWRWYVTAHDECVQAESRIIGFEPDGMWPCAALEIPAVGKVLVISGEKRSDRLERLLGALPDTLDGAISKPGYLEITRKGISKLGALDTLMTRRGWRLGQLVAVGDGDNDIPMVEQAGLGIAMGNGTDKLKSCARVVVASNDEDGLLELLAPWNGFLAGD